MRVRFLFTKFMRSFGIGFACGLSAVAVIAVLAFAVYCLYFA